MSTTMDDWQLPEVKRPTLDDPEILQLGILANMDELVNLHEELIAARDERLTAAQALRLAQENVDYLKNDLATCEDIMAIKPAEARTNELKRLEYANPELASAIGEMKQRRIVHERAAEKVVQREIAYDTCRRRQRSAEAVLNFLGARP